MAIQKLSVGAVGDSVAELHTRLQSHGNQIPAAELARKFFGPGTRQAIARFQASHGIEATCEVCDATAAQLATSTTAPDSMPTTVPARRGEARSACARGDNPGQSPAPDDPTPQYWITGTVVPPQDVNRSGIHIQATDRDMPSLERRVTSSPQLLGEATTDSDGRFQIAYMLEQFKVGEGRSPSGGIATSSADVSFRVFDQKTGQQLNIKNIEALDHRYRGDQIIFNVPTRLEVTIVLDTPQEPVDTSEFGQLNALLAPVIRDLPLADLSDDDIAFVTSELGVEQQPEAQRIEWLRRCARMAHEANLPIEAFYGWGRKDVPARLSELATVPLTDLPAVHEKLAGLGDEKLRGAILAAIQENIVPAALRARVDRIARQLTRRGQERLQANARLVDAETGSPLAAHSVTTFDDDAGGESLGLDITDSKGGFFFLFHQSRGATPAQARKFSFRVVAPSGEALPEAALTAIRPTDTGNQVVTVKIRTPQRNVPLLLEQLTNSQSINQPAVLKWLTRNGISTLADIRRKGGLRNAEGMPSSDPALTQRLEALADLDRISPSAAVNERLLNKGYDSVLAIANAPRSQFLSVVSDESTALTRLEAERLHWIATTQTNLLNNILIRMAVDSANGFGSPGRPDKGGKDNE